MGTAPLTWAKYHHINQAVSLLQNKRGRKIPLCFAEKVSYDRVA
jgi:hypothetical protein